MQEKNPEWPGAIGNGTESERKTVNNCFSRSDVLRCEKNESSVPRRSFSTQKWTGAYVREFHR